jgi:hypothetical protein
MTTEDLPRCTEDAVLRVQALGFLFDWLSSEDFRSPCDFEQLSQVNELRRFFTGDREDGRLRAQVLCWLQDNKYVRFEEKRRPGRRREKEYSYAEQRRAEAALWSGWSGWLADETLKRYRTVLGEHKTREYRYVVVEDNLFALFEEHYGLPNGCTPTEFARSHGLPRRLVNAWVRNLVERELVRVVFVRGKRVVKVLCRK